VSLNGPRRSLGAAADALPFLDSGFIWAAFTWISIPFVWFLIPEFKGLSLERIDYLFERKVATRQFQSYQSGLDEENVPTVSHSGSLDKAEADK
jgi:hypothetical protein